MARKPSESRPVCPKVSNSDFGRNEPCNFGLNPRGLGFFRTMLDTLLGGHFASLCKGFDFYKVKKKKKKFLFEKENGNTVTLSNHNYSEKSSKRANSTNHPV